MSCFLFFIYLCKEQSSHLKQCLIVCLIRLYFLRIILVKMVHWRGFGWYYLIMQSVSCLENSAITITRIRKGVEWGFEALFCELAACGYGWHLKPDRFETNNLMQNILMLLLAVLGLTSLKVNQHMLSLFGKFLKSMKKIIKYARVDVRSIILLLCFANKPHRCRWLSALSLFLKIIIYMGSYADEW